MNGNGGPRAEPRHHDLDRLIAAAKRGDDDAFIELYEAHFDGVYSYLRVALNDSAEAAEATQEIFMKVLRCIERYDRGAESFAGWLLAIARNHVVMRLRKRSVRGAGGRGGAPAGDGDVANANASASASAEQMLRGLRSASDEELLLLLERLPEAQRQAIALRYVLGFDRRETARVLGRSEAVTEKLQTQALAGLRRRLTALGSEGSTSRLPMRLFRARRGALQPAHSVTLLR